jgi:hypothetical protein
MKLSTKRGLGGIGLLFTILGGWFFIAGFEIPWTASHITALVFLIFGLVLAIYGYGRTDGG